jgi:hypothetical protein
VGAGALEVTDDPVSLGDQVNDPHREVGEGCLEGVDPAAGDPGEVALRDLVEPVGRALRDDLVDEAANELLVGFAAHPPIVPDGTASKATPP